MYWSSDKDGAYHVCIQKDLDAGVADKNSECWLSQDNLETQKQEIYKKMTRELNQSLSWYTRHLDLKLPVNRNHLQIWPSFPAEDRNSLAWGLPTKQACFRSPEDSLHRHIW